MDALFTPAGPDFAEPVEADLSHRLIIFPITPRIAEYDVVYPWITNRRSAALKTLLEEGEQLVRRGGANLQRGRETVGGFLYLTNRRLVFEAHKFNFQRQSTQIALADIERVVPCWTKFLGVLPLLPNSLSIQTKSGVYDIVLFGRAAWRTAIESGMGAGARLPG